MFHKLENIYGDVFEKSLIDDIKNIGINFVAKKGDILIDYGSYIKNTPLLLSGALKVLREDEDGREILLYFIEKGDTCAFSLSCCIGNKKSKIKVIAIEDSEIVFLPIQKIEKWLCKYHTWRNFVFNSYNSKMNEMLQAIDALAFMKMDERLYKLLTDKVKIMGNTILYNTHKEIAESLNTSRVVVSRLLKKLEKEGKLKLYRNKIKVLYG